MIKQNQQLMEVLLLANLTDAERDLLQNIYSFHGFKIQEWKSNNRFPDLKKQSIIVLNDFSVKTIKSISERSIGVIGRLNSEEKTSLITSGVVFFWDLEKYNLTGLPIFTIHNHYPLKVLISTKNRQYNKIFKEIFRSLSCLPLIASGFIESITFLKNERFDICIIDWDAEDMNLNLFLNELKNIRYLPVFIGIKDFKKENLFQSLSSGIKDYTETLFTMNELVEILIHSMPLTPLNQFSVNDTNDKIISLILQGNIIERFEVKQKFLSNETYELFTLKKSLEWLIKIMD